MVRAAVVEAAEAAFDSPREASALTPEPAEDWAERVAAFCRTIGETPPRRAAVVACRPVRVTHESTE